MLVSSVRHLRQRAEIAWTQAPAWLIVSPLVLLGAVLRFYRVESNGLNLDEAWSLWMVKHSTADIVRKIWFESGDATPPTYYVLLHGFISLGDGLVALRALSVIAGALTVWLVFRLAADLFGQRAAALSAFLLAIAPLQIEYSQEARAYMLTQLLEVLSLYFLARVLFGDQQRRHWVGLVASTAAALYTFYLAFLLVIFQNLVFAFLWYRKRLQRTTRNRWLVSEAALGLLYLPIAIPALLIFRGQEAGFGQTWLGRPGLQSLVKTAILFGTGDPSYGPISFTAARAASLLVVVGIAGYGGWMFVRGGSRRLLNKEGRTVIFLTSAILIPWGMAFIVSQKRPIYHEKYLLFLMPLMLIFLAWAVTRQRMTFAAVILLLSLLGLTGAALYVQESSPVGEQWREATVYLQAKYKPDDLVVISPGYYTRPFAYYFLGNFPPDAERFSRAPAVVMENGELTALQVDGLAGSGPVGPDLLASAQRVWFVTGFSAPNGDVAARLERELQVVEEGDFLGARVRLMR